MNGRLHQHALRVDLDLQLTHRSQKSSSKESNYRSKMGCERFSFWYHGAENSPWMYPCLTLFHLIAHAAEDMQGKTEEEIEMMKLMGFGAFDSTKVRTLSLLLNHDPVHSTRTTKREVDVVCSLITICIVFYFLCLTNNSSVLSSCLQFFQVAKLIL